MKTQDIPNRKPRTKKYPRTKKGKQVRKTRITHQKAEKIRQNMDKPVSKLEEATGLTEYVVRIIQEAKRNDYWRQSSYCEGLHKGDKMTDEMEQWLANADYKNPNQMTVAFNQKFSGHELLPVSYHTVRSLHEELKTRENSQN